MTEITYTINQNGISSVSSSINEGRLHLQVAFEDGRALSPTQDGIPIQPAKADDILKALDALKELLTEHGIARRRG